MLNENEVLMFTNISWVSYLTIVTVTLVVWYLFIGTKFYYNDIKGFLGSKRKSQFHSYLAEQEENETFRSDSEKAKQTTATAVSPKQSLSDFEIVEELVERVKGVIKNAVEHDAAKEDFLHNLTTVLKGYPTLKQSQFRGSINEFIVSEAEQLDLLSITQEEVELLWNNK